MSIDVIARSVRGAEYVVAEEIASAGPAHVALRPREVRFRLPRLDPGAGDLRTADDVFLLVGEAGEVGHGKDSVALLARQAREWDWRAATQTVGALREFSERGGFDVVASLRGRRNFSRFDVEDAVGAALSRELGRRYLTRRPGAGEQAPQPALTVRVFVEADTASFALRLAAGPLHRRGYKQDTAPGTLHPPMAAVLARMLAAGAGEVVSDPFCGDGTIPIEVAAFAPGALIHGCDRDPARVRNAAANAARAGADVSFSVSDAGGLGSADGCVDALAANPPWNLAVEASGLLAGGLSGFWSEAERVLSPHGRMAIIMDAGLAPADELRRRGFHITLAQAVRLAGRVSQIVVCTPRGRSPWPLPSGIAAWRERARSAGLVTETGFE